MGECGDDVNGGRNSPVFMGWGWRKTERISTVTFKGERIPRSELFKED